jgi:hypothetical protein
MKKGESWLAMSVNFFEHPGVQSLTDTQKCAFLNSLCKAKSLRNGGEFANRRHLSIILGVRYARAVPRLIAEGFLIESQDGRIVIDNYDRWQVDRTSADRQRRHRARIAAESRQSDTVYRNVKDTEKETDTLSKARSLMSVGEIMARGGVK